MVPLLRCSRESGRFVRRSFIGGCLLLTANRGLGAPRPGVQQHSILKFNHDHRVESRRRRGGKGMVSLLAARNLRWTELKRNNGFRISGRRLNP